MKFEVEIDHIRVVQGSGADEIMIYPKGWIMPVHPFTDGCVLSLSSAPTHTSAFLLQHFPGVLVRWYPKDA